MPHDTVDELLDAIRTATSGPADAYAAVLERALDTCAADPAAARELDELELHDELAGAYDRLGRVEEALAHAAVLVERGYRCMPDPRCRSAEILMRHGRAAEAAGIWDDVARDTPDDVWVYNNAGLAYAEIGDHETALSWLTPGLELALRTGDPERLLVQLRSLRARSLAALGLPEDALQSADPVASTSVVTRPPARPAAPPTSSATNTPLAYAWLPADEYAHIEQRWPDIAVEESVRDEAGALVDHPEYCRRLEVILREAADSGFRRLHVATLSRESFDAWVADTGRTGEDEAGLRAGYAADLARRRTDVVAWPPGRNDPCWCCSGTKYKKCCAARARA